MQAPSKWMVEVRVPHRALHNFATQMEWWRLDHGAHGNYGGLAGYAHGPPRCRPVKTQGFDDGASVVPTSGAPAQQ
ncbi:hypothetical protein [Paenarthrobacter sp. TA1.8]|uniref:hypothetical protein n=1 Tax=Paenarthrobacter sp. TA1.8 TaxID=3400219 RepID=UPI003B42F5CB